jgi:AcrR family transcriptional regulator
VKPKTTRAVKAPTEGKPPKPRGSRWGEIVKASAEVFHERGYDAATLQDIADRVGILKGSIYYYIKTKSDLLESLLIDLHNETLEMVQTAASGPGGVFDKLGALIRAQVHYITRNPARTSVMLREIRHIDPARRRALFTDHGFRDEIQKLIELGQEQDIVLRDLDPELTAQTILVGMSSIHQWYRPRGRFTPDQIADHLVTTTIRSIAARSPP